MKDPVIEAKVSELKETVEKVRSQILDGNVKIHNFLDTNSCLANPSS